ncbi:MAG: DUF835 domain-containing protein [Methanobacteriota archaeon]|nr:MAG: DUF835 domain-containing protein [Euryarchaeota archaeon]
MEPEQLLGDVLPRIVGLSLIALSLVLIYRVRREFFIVVRGWIVISFVVILALFWIYEVTMSIAAPSDWSTHPIVGILFVVTVSWLSVFVVSATTLYRRTTELDAFMAWLKGKPVNLVTTWGAVGLAVLIISVVASQTSEKTLSDDPWLLGPVFAYLLTSILIDMAMPLSMRTRGDLRRLPKEYRTSMVLLATAWVGLPTLEFVFDLLLGSIGTDDFDPLYPWMMILLFLMLTRSVMSNRFASMVIHAEVEMSEKGGFRPYDIPRGAYLIEDETSESSLALFTELVSLPLRPDVTIPTGSESASDTLSFLIPKGLVVTRMYPERIRETSGLQVTPIIWLTESTGDKRIPPTSVAQLADAMAKFMESNPNSIVLLDGIEYLLTFNDFNRVLRSLDSLNETVWITKSRLLIAVNPKALERRELAMMERDRVVVRGSEEIDRLKHSSERFGKVGTIPTGVAKG